MGITNVGTIMEGVTLRVFYFPSVFMVKFTQPKLNANVDTFSAFLSCVLFVVLVPKHQCNVMRAILLDLYIHIYLYFCLDINQFKLFDYVLSTDSMVICKTHASRLSVEPAQELPRAFFQSRKFHAIPEADFF